MSLSLIAGFVIGLVALIIFGIGLVLAAQIMGFVVWQAILRRGFWGGIIIILVFIIAFSLLLALRLRNISYASENNHYTFSTVR